MGNVVPFNQHNNRKAKKLSAQAWVPCYDYNVVNGIGYPYWTGEEALCELRPNPDYEPGSREIPFLYEPVRDALNRQFIRKAPPPSCSFEAFDWDALEREAFQ